MINAVGAERKLKVMLDPQCAEFLSPSIDAPELIDISIPSGRAGAYAAISLSGTVSNLVTIFNRYIPGPTADILVRSYTPNTPGPHSAMVYFHGGGWAYFSVDFYDAQLSNLSEKADCVIFSVNYQKAPEHKFPIPHDDCYAGLQWVFENASSLNIVKSQIGVGGDSAGGNLAAGVALRARDESSLNMAFQLLIYPCLGVNFETESYLKNAKGYGLSKRTMSWLWSLYLETEEDKANPYAVPLSAKNLRNLPPTIVITAEYDVLKDDGKRYAELLSEHKNSVVYKDFAGMIHGFFNYGTVITQGVELQDWIAQRLREVVGN